MNLLASQPRSLLRSGRRELAVWGAWWHVLLSGAEIVTLPRAMQQVVVMQMLDGLLAGSATA